jgi:hypothetical protein
MFCRVSEPLDPHDESSKLKTDDSSKLNFSQIIFGSIPQKSPAQSAAEPDSDCDEWNDDTSAN